MVPVPAPAMQCIERTDRAPVQGSRCIARPLGVREPVLRLSPVD